MVSFQTSYNFTCKWMLPPDRQFGKDMGNGSYSGIYGMLQRREVDYAAAGLVFLVNILDIIE